MSNIGLRYCGISVTDFPEEEFKEAGNILFRAQAGNRKDEPRMISIKIVRRNWRYI